MHTVARFVHAPEGPEAALNDVVALLTRLGGGRLEFRKSGAQVSCSVHAGDLWPEHEEAMVNFIEHYETVIRLAQTGGMSFEFDVAMEPGDYAGRTLAGFKISRELVEILARFQASFEVTLYVGQP